MFLIDHVNVNVKDDVKDNVKDKDTVKDKDDVKDNVILLEDNSFA